MAGRQLLRALRAAMLAAPGLCAGDFAAAQSADLPVDLELVIAVDVSRSMDFYEAELQRQGYAQALEHPLFLRAIMQSGEHGRIAVAYVEWAGVQHQKLVSDWVVIAGEEGAAVLAERIRTAPFESEYRTSISEAIRFSMALFEDNGFDGARRVIDISGDGANNQGLPVLAARAAAIERGITINGLPIMTERPNPFGWLTVENLDVYYADCVVGGPGSFLVPVRERSEFVEAIRRKLLLEIAGLTPPREGLVIRAQSISIPCLGGERQWERYMERYNEP